MTDLEEEIINTAYDLYDVLSSEREYRRFPGHTWLPPGLGISKFGLVHRGPGSNFLVVNGLVTDAEKLESWATLAITCTYGFEERMYCNYVRTIKYDLRGVSPQGTQENVLGYWSYLLGLLKPRVKGVDFRLSNRKNNMVHGEPQ